MTEKEPMRKAISLDIVIEGLRTSVFLLETELSVLENRRSDLYKRLNGFRVRYNVELGMLLGDILRLRMEEFCMLQDNNPRSVRLDEAESDYKKHQETMKESGEAAIVQTLSKVRDKELQQKFYKASKLCHPDLVEELHRQRATEIFMDLGNAYYYNNLERVSAILQMLEQNHYGLTSRSAALTNKAMLEMYESRLKIDIDRRKEELKQIRQSRPYISLMDMEDEDLYFGEMKRKLTEERGLMVQRLEKMRTVDNGE